MKRTYTQPLLAAALAVLFAGVALPVPAQAKAIKLWEELDDDDGTVVVMYYQPDGKFHFAIIISDGVSSVYRFPNEDNPEDTSTGPGSHTGEPDVVRMIKVGEATYKVRIVPADSPELLAHLKGNGGLGPRYNPSDDDNGNGPGSAPSHSMQVKKTPDEVRAEIAAANEVADELATLGVSMGDGDEGGGEGPAGFNKDGSGDADNDDGNYTEGQNKTVGKTEKDLLGAKPELVNPPHQSGGGRSTNAGSAHGAGGGSLGGGAHAGASTHS